MARASEGSTPALASPTAASGEDRRALAPTGILRVGVYRGSPSSIVEGPTPNDAKGVGYDLGRALATALGVPFRAVVFPANDGLLAAVAAGDVDVTFTNATAERGKTLDFSDVFMDVQKSFLVPTGSPLDRQEDFRRPGLGVGVSQGSSTATELRPIFPGLDLAPVATLEDGVALLAAHRLDAFSTNDAILFQMSDELPGHRGPVGGGALRRRRAEGTPRWDAVSPGFRHEGGLRRHRGKGCVARQPARHGPGGRLTAASRRISMSRSGRDVMAPQIGCMHGRSLGA